VTSADPPPPDLSARPRLKAVLRYLPLVALVAIALAAWRSGLLHRLSLGHLAEQAADLRAAAATSPATALGGFILIYAALTGACLPVALVLSLLGGLVFGRDVGACAVLLGATGAAMVTYGTARTAFAAALLARAERDPRLGRIMQGFGRNAFSYILTLRLLPFFPFALVNIASGLAAVPLGAYAAATLLGGIPTAVIYSSLGASLGESLRSEQSLMDAVEAPGVIIPLAALAGLSLAPALYRRLRRRDMRPEDLRP
jgi:uncharacterized membrane protein YdjX (TVP38/TMEM64 family)